MSDPSQPYSHGGSADSLEAREGGGNGCVAAEEDYRNKLLFHHYIHVSITLACLTAVVVLLLLYPELPSNIVTAMFAIVAGPASIFTMYFKVLKYIKESRKEQRKMEGGCSDVANSQSEKTLETYKVSERSTQAVKEAQKRQLSKKESPPFILFEEDPSATWRRAQLREQ